MTYSEFYAEKQKLSAIATEIVLKTFNFPKFIHHIEVEFRDDGIVVKLYDNDDDCRGDVRFYSINGAINFKRFEIDVDFNFHYNVLPL